MGGGVTGRPPPIFTPQGVPQEQLGLKGQLDLERHGGRTPAGVFTRIAQRLLAMAAAIWHNWQTGATDLRSLIAYDH